MSHYKALFDTLSEKQLGVLGAIAMGQDRGLGLSTSRTLVQLGLIEEHCDVSDTAERWQFARYRMPIYVHINWCEWCSEKVGVETSR